MLNTAFLNVIGQNFNPWSPDSVPKQIETAINVWKSIDWRTDCKHIFEPIEADVLQYEYVSLCLMAALKASANLGPTIKRKQHILPKSLIREFQVNGNTRVLFPGGEIKTVPTGSDYFYELDGYTLPDDSRLFEQLFSLFESHFFSVMDRRFPGWRRCKNGSKGTWFPRNIHSRQLRFHKRERIILTTFFITQWMRSRYQKELHRDWSNANKDLWTSEGLLTKESLSALSSSAHSWSQEDVLNYFWDNPSNQWSKDQITYASSIPWQGHILLALNPLAGHDSMFYDIWDRDWNWCFDVQGSFSHVLKSHIVPFASPDSIPEDLFSSAKDLPIVLEMDQVRHLTMSLTPHLAVTFSLPDSGTGLAPFNPRYYGRPLDLEFLEQTSFKDMLLIHAPWASEDFRLPWATVNRIRKSLLIPQVLDPILLSPQEKYPEDREKLLPQPTNNLPLKGERVTWLGKPRGKFQTLESGKNSASFGKNFASLVQSLGAVVSKPSRSVTMCIIFDSAIPIPRKMDKAKCLTADQFLMMIGL